MQIKTPVKELLKRQAKTEEVYDLISEKLSSDKGNGYTILGLMVDCFGIDKKKIENKPFKDWEKGLPSLYTKIRICCELLREEKKVGKIINRRAYHYYWLSDKKLVKALMDSSVEV